jgi:hypothetical protein
MVMKTMKFVFTMMTVAVAAIATGAEKPRMDVIPLTSNKAIVAIENENPAVFEVSIEANNGDLVYYKQTTNPITDYRKVFNFANLETGAYVFNLKVNDTKVSNDFEVSPEGIVIGASKMRFDPYFQFSDNVLKLSYLNFDKEDLKLNLYGDNKLVYKTKLGSDFNIATGYNLSKLKKGSYQVVLSSLSKKFTFELKK